MAQKKAHEVEVFLKNKPQSYDIFLIYGQDKGLVAEYVALFVQNCGIDSKDPFAYVNIDGDNADKDAANIIEEAQTIALFGGKRLLKISYNGQGIKGGVSSAVKFLLQKPLVDCFILIEAGDLKKTSALRKIVEDSARGIALPCYADEQKTLQKLIRDVTLQFHCTIEADARAVLEDNLGGNRLLSRAELEKLCLYAQQSKNITVEDIKNIGSDVGALAANDIVDAVICGDLLNFDKNFTRHYAAGTQSFVILAAVTRQFMQLQFFKYSMEVENKDIASIIAAARPPIFFKRRKILETALVLWTGVKIERALERLQKTLLDSRKYSELGTDIIRQNLLALTVEAARSNNLKKS